MARVYPGGGQTLEGEQGPVCSLLLSPLPCFCLCFGCGEVGMGTSVFSVRFIVTGFFYCCFKIFCLFYCYCFISLSGLLLFLPTLSDSLPPRWGEEPVKPSQVVCMIAGNLSKRDYFLATGLLLCLVYFGC